MQVLLDWLYAILDGIVSLILSVWPSTPEAFKISHMFQGLMSAWPDAPWFLMGDLLGTLAWILPVVAIVKVLKVVIP